MTLSDTDDPEGSCGLGIQANRWNCRSLSPGEKQPRSWDGGNIKTEFQNIHEQDHSKEQVQSIAMCLLTICGVFEEQCRAV